MYLSINCTADDEWVEMATSEAETVATSTTLTNFLPVPHPPSELPFSPSPLLFFLQIPQGGAGLSEVAKGGSSAPNSEMSCVGRGVVHSPDERLHPRSRSLPAATLRKLEFLFWRTSACIINSIQMRVSIGRKWKCFEMRSKTSSCLTLIFFVHALSPLCSSSSSTIPHPNEDVAVALGALEVDKWEVAYTHLSRARKDSESAPGPFWTTQLHKLLGVSAYKSGREAEGEKYLVEACDLDPEMCAEVKKSSPSPIPTSSDVDSRPHNQNNGTANITNITMQEPLP